MFIKPYFKQNKTTGDRYTVYKLCESYRLNGGIHHRIIIGFGRLEELETVEQKKLLATRIEDMLTNGGNVLSTSMADEMVEQLARQFYAEILKKRQYDFKPGNWEFETVNMATLRNKDGREIGAEWLCQQAFNQLGIGNFLRQAGWDQDRVALATTHIISRAVYPASKLKTVSFIRENSAVVELTGFNKDLITKDMLCGILAITNPYKLILPDKNNKPGEEIKLFNIIEDPHETQNLAEQMPEITADLQDRIKEFWSE